MGIFFSLPLNFIYFPLKYLSGVFSLAEESLFWPSYSGLIWNMCHFISVFTFLFFFFFFTLTAACRWQQLEGDNRNGRPSPCCPCSLYSERGKTKHPYWAQHIHLRIPMQEGTRGVSNFNLIWPLKIVSTQTIAKTLLTPTVNLKTHSQSWKKTTIIFFILYFMMKTMWSQSHLLAAWAGLMGEGLIHHEGNSILVCPLSVMRSPWTDKFNNWI